MVGTTNGVKLKKVGDDLHMDVFQGKTINFSVAITDSSDNAIDLTNYTARMSLRETFESGTTRADFTEGNSRISMGTSNGLITISMTSTDCSTVQAGKGVYDLELENEGNGDVDQVMSGTFEVLREVTR